MTTNATEGVAGRRGAFSWWRVATCPTCGLEFDPRTPIRARSGATFYRMRVYCVPQCRGRADKARRAAKPKVDISNNPAALARQKQQAGKRHGIDPATCERDYSDEERLWLVAVEKRRRELGGQLSPGQVLELARACGYRKVT